MYYLKFFLTIIFLLSHFDIIAAPAYPFPIRVKTPKGSVSITLQGDENCKYAYTDDGYTVVSDGEKWFFAQYDESNRLKTTSYELEEQKNRSTDLIAFLSTQTKYKNPSRSRQAGSYSKRVSPGEKIEGKRKMLIVLMSFADYSFIKEVNDFDALFNQPGYSEDGASGSVYDYYQYVSYGQLELECTVIGPFTAAENMAYYGGNKGMSESDKNPFALFREALQYAHASVDLKEYDGNGDGYIDNFHIIYAGHGEESGASSDAIWAHELTFEAITIEGLKIDRYSCAPELRGRTGIGISRIGPHCHEIGHALGASDYYDTNYTTGGGYIGTGKWDVMASGSWNNEGINPANFNPYVKAYDFGWSDVEILTGEGELSLKPSCYDATIFRLNTPMEDDYFLLENRQQESFDSAVPGHGMLIYHIGPQIETKRTTNAINATFPQECYVVCASAVAMRPTSAPLSYGDINSAGCPYPGVGNNTLFTEDSTPAANTFSGGSAGFILTEIQETTDGDIHLKYSADNTSTVVEPFPQEGEIVWEERFDDAILNDFWSQQSIVNNSRWTICRRLSSGKVESFAGLSSDTSGFDLAGYYSKTHLISSVLDEEDSDYILSFQYAHSSITGNDSLNILVMNNEIGQWETISKNKIATDYFVNKKVLVSSKYLPFVLCFEGIVSRDSRIMIDNILLRKAETTIKISPSIDIEKKNDMVFSISGIRNNTLLPGINVINKPGLKYKVIMHK